MKHKGSTIRTMLALVLALLLALTGTAVAEDPTPDGLVGSDEPQEDTGPTVENLITYSQTILGTDYVSTGCGGMRNTGACNVGLTVAGVGSGTVTKALLYWNGPTNTTDPLANANVTFSGNSVTGTNIGFSNDNCWGYANSQAYVADVTAFVPGDGNYTLSGFGSGSVNTNGASLLVFFDDGASANNRDIVLFHGNDSNISNPYDPPGWNVTLSGINYTSGTAAMELHVADGQQVPNSTTGWDDALILNGSTLVPTGPIFSGTSVPGDNNGPANNGNLWDIRSEDVTSFLSPGPNTLNLTTGVWGDCLGLVVAGINLPAGAAPNQPPVADANGPYSGDEGSPISLDGTGSSDPDGDSLTYSWTVDSALCSFDDATSPTPNLTCTDNGDFTVTLLVDDGQATDDDQAAVTVYNVAPTVGGIGVWPTLVPVGTPISADADFHDPGWNDTHTAVWDWGDVTTPGTITPGGQEVIDSHTYSAAGVYEITLTVTDDDGDSGQSVFQYIVVYDPAAGFVTGGGWIDSPGGAYYPFAWYELVEDPFISWTEANTAASEATMEGCDYSHLATITSQEEQDALYEWFDGALQGKWYGGFQEPGVTIPDEGWHWVTEEPWEYTNWAPGEPNDAYGPGTEPHLIGWLDGWAWNDEGNLGNVTGYVVESEGCGPTGKATFGFVSKYKKGATTPTGNTEFQFHAAYLNFHSDSYEWLVVTGSNYAKFKGVGTINGEGEYKFKLWAGDDDPDTFRIKIWVEDEFGVETVVYDNGFDQEIGGGSIVVHTKK